MEKKHGGARPNSGRPSVKDELKGVDLASPHVEDAFRTIVEVMQSKESNARDRIASAKILIEYGCGKPKETIDTTHTINNFELKDVFSFDSSK